MARRIFSRNEIEGSGPNKRGLDARTYSSTALIEAVRIIDSYIHGMAEDHKSIGIAKTEMSHIDLETPLSKKLIEVYLAAGWKQAFFTERYFCLDTRSCHEKD